MATKTDTVIQGALEHLRAELPGVLSMEWLDDHRDDVATALTELGVTGLSNGLGVSANTLKTWRRRRGLAPGGDRQGQKAAELVDAGGGDTVALDSIEPNPWQPRKTIDPEDLATLAESIDTSDLLQVPIGRRLESGLVQLAFGHRRVEAIRLLATSGKWVGGVPVSVRELSDQQMAIFALEENSKRKDINPLEQYLGFQKVIDDGLLNVTELAASVGLARPTVANNLRILNLPAEALEHFRIGELSAHAARELLVLWAPDHDHNKDILAVLRDIDRTSQYHGAPDWSVKSVRQHIRDRVSGANAQAWRPAFRQEDRGTGYSTGSAYGLPTFDVAAFSKEHPTMVHTIPAHGDKGEAWTCNVREWQRLQSAATRAENRAVHENRRPAMDEKETETYLMALAADPVLQAIKTGAPVASAPPGVSQETLAAADAEVDPGRRGRPTGLSTSTWPAWWPTSNGRARNASTPAPPGSATCATRTRYTTPRRTSRKWRPCGPGGTWRPWTTVR